jgi:DNA-binding NarL/FixJ family response regulator
VRKGRYAGGRERHDQPDGTRREGLRRRGGGEHEGEEQARLKSSPQTRDIPIIGLSAHAMAGEREKAMAAGCNEFDHKPVEFERLVATIRRMLAGSK